VNPLAFVSTVRIAVRALGRNKLRSTLTALGIIIGVGAVISMVAIGSGARAQVAAQVASLGQNVIMVYASSSSSSTGVRLGAGTSPTLSVDDADAIRNEIGGVVAVSPELYSYSQVVAGNQNWKTKIYGEGPDYLKIRQWEVAEGENFSQTDVRSACKVALIGQTAAHQLFGDQSPVGEIVRVQNVPFTIVGLLESKGFSVKGHDQDDVLIIPYSTALKRLMGNSTPLYAIHLEAAEADSLETVQKQTTELLRQRHRIAAGREDDFVVRSQQEIAATAIATARTMTVLLAAIAGVSLVVGGIGIMNIMLVSVTERTREIGVRMAVGARSSDILRQFLIEAFTLSSLGGVLGIGVGIATSRILAATAHWPTLISPEAVVLAVVFSGAVGVFFGFYPARKASRLNPIDALRYE
jgi:putative ABC transport system permease protein